ncbi:hypothetical protein F5148DRAFT_475093 [Russula earlei]|uniref:Uncharacterized protein n=1 Tax=Russula earlei TaxID=71964 RepID=A0ACC0TZC5_9AGAM|nr:hypothetical protein F5148DRAFT_475093 [Russula earlei]
MAWHCRRNLRRRLTGSGLAVSVLAPATLFHSAAVLHIKDGGAERLWSQHNTTTFLTTSPSVIDRSSGSTYFPLPFLQHETFGYPAPITLHSSRDHPHR